MCCDRRFAKLEATANIRECGSDLIQESFVCNTQRQIDTVVESGSSSGSGGGVMHGCGV